MTTSNVLAVPVSSDSLIERHRISEVADLVRAAAIAGDERELAALLRDLSESTASAIEASYSEIVRHRSRLDRVRHQLEDLSGWPLGDRVLGGLEADDRLLDISRTRAVGQAQQTRQSERDLGVRERVFALLAVPQRPGQIAEALGCDQSEASRAIAQLLRLEKIVQVATPDGVGADGRARWFAQHR